VWSIVCLPKSRRQGWAPQTMLQAAAFCDDRNNVVNKTSPESEDKEER
jgi:hypothetical protein